MTQWTDDEITKLTQAVEQAILAHGIHLTTDRYNDLDDYIRNLIASIEENGQ